MPPIPASFPGPATTLTLTPLTVCTVQLPANPTASDIFYAMDATILVERAAGSAYVKWLATFEESPIPQGQTVYTLETGAVKGIFMSAPTVSGPPTQESQSHSQVIKSAKMSAAMNVLLKVSADGSGIKVLGESDSAGEKVTTLTAYRIL